MTTKEGVEEEAAENAADDTKEHHQEQLHPRHVFDRHVVCNVGLLQLARGIAAIDELDQERERGKGLRLLGEPQHRLLVGVEQEPLLGHGRAL